MLTFVAALALAIAPLLSTVWLCRRILRQGPTSKAVSVFLRVVIVFSLVGALGTTLGMIKVFQAVGGESVDPSQKARVLAEGMSEAMSWTAFSALVWVPSTIALVVILRRKPKPQA
jgi:biopolymer transport protein ExbB